ncbi:MULTISPECIES: hypothetical protein [Spirosoma]|uniref:DUF1328 domain-containing protein n=1 Tax=Spirosoma liriopis TaxID=2937440 RepID=A0ABT0HJS7_9BACT|nr:MULTISPECIES: hypothetical protein [Spirosoma]MCK8492421.1 hypothetical protein [Spirosoma liriopis]UHG91894.1 hypothetical protein LQ777_03090 [Spirosoma oryzicola]
MNVKSIFGIILTLVGLIGLVYGGIDFTKGGVAQASFVYLILGGIFFFTGVSLIRGTRA